MKAEKTKKSKQKEQEYEEYFAKSPQAYLAPKDQFKYTSNSALLFHVAYELKWLLLLVFTLVAGYSL